MIAGAYFSLLYLSYLYAALTVFSMFSFGVGLKLHGRLRKKITHIKALIFINQVERDYVLGRFENLCSGSEFQVADHLFSGDIDLLGTGSMFQRINRCAVYEAKRMLADQLLNPDFSNLQSKQAVVRELTPETDWRHRFQAIASRLKSMVSMDQMLTWCKQQASHSFLLKPFVIWPLTLVFPSAVLAAIIFGFSNYVDYLLYPFLLNLLLFSSILKQIKKDHAHVDKLTKDLEVYAELITLIENSPHESAILKLLKSKLKSEVSATQSIQKLSGLLNQMDSMYNLLGGIFLNGIGLYHLHIYAALQKWRSKNGALISDWIEVVQQYDYWVSLANYAFNHPGFNYPILSKDQDYRAVGLGHPFLSEQKCVRNDVDFGQFKMMILTGSNMAGKSTFLRAIGLSIVQAALGVPVCAKSLQLSPRKLLSSMKPQDSINEDRSYFQAEILKLRAIMDVLETGEPCFVLLDEILRGTNSDDKRNGTKAFLNRIKAFNLKGCLATHDIEIAELTASDSHTFANMYFESIHEDGQLKFDYKLRSGVCTTPNATALLKINGII